MKEVTQNDTREASSSFHSHLVGVVGRGPASVDAVGCHDGPHVVTLHQQLVLALGALLVDVDDGTGDLGYTLNHHLGA